MVKDMSPDDVKDIINTTKLVLIDCWAPWCKPCLTLTPILEELDEKFSNNDDVQFMKINTQDHRGFAMENKVVAIPCVLIYHNGEPARLEVPDPRGGPPKILDRLVGLRPIEHYEAVIEKLL